MERLTDSNKEIPSLKNERKWLDMYFKLKEYEDAEENGLLVRLPCELGTFVYGISSKRGKDDLNVYRTFFGYKDIDQLGKTVFLTKAEAKAKLKEMEDENE